MARTPISALARGVDPRVRSNRHALTVAVVAGAAGTTVGWLADPGDLRHALGGGVAWGLTSFFAWATGRELDHDDPRGALVAALLAPAALAWVGGGRPMLLTTAALLVAARLSLRSTGLGPRGVDLAGVVILGVLVAGSPAGWAAAMVLAVALVREATRSSQPVVPARWVGFGLAVAATIRLGLAGGYPLPPLEGGAAVWAVVVGGLAVAAALAGDRRPPLTPCDHITDPPRSTDQWVARVLTGVAAAAVTILAVDPIAVIGTVAALVGVAVVDRLRPPPS